MTVTPYCLPTDIRNNVAGTDDGTGTCAALTDTQLGQAIEKASAKVSAYTGMTWGPDAAVPTAVVPDLVFNLTVAIGTFYATLTYRKGRDLSAQDPVYLGYTDAMATLKDIVSGNIEVVPPTPGGPPDSPGHVVNTLPRIFHPSDAGVMRDGRGGIMPEGPRGSSLRDGWF